ncbi:cytochrome c biogenesis protein ResB [Streptacidiphilus sp. PB12-B1b]|uniref:cytochrome c biogenesis protein ResB n=1 Tax=Streptacidiphilus sp. PB12-B1b TaxID=2705012 RepID=UPI0015FD6354|nr:cytochrome c biogenesis protein ResB [Streptacidiphilus sp. PB12-B1b]QMU79493.1 cytochrome c biogenesis protein ResB [Streptacidiphilus sp. PB12-B1b]
MSDRPGTDARDDLRDDGVDTDAAAADSAVADTAAEQSELAAAERLSSAPREDPADLLEAEGGEVAAPGGTVGIGVLGWLRWGWRQLTSMRIALILLFLLSLAAVPGSLVPQTSASQINVDNFHTNHKILSPIFDKLQMFDVYGSFWFSAIYILLFVSLLGCIVPRTWQFVGVLRAKPPVAPRHLVRLPVYATWRTSADADAVLAASASLLRRRRFRTARAAEGSVSSEKGYLREVGNLLFHVSLIALLVAFAATKLFGGMGTVVVVEGQGFSNNVTQYDDFFPSEFYTANSLDPFSFTLNNFQATYQTSGDQFGTPRTYAAHITYRIGSGGGKPVSGTIKVNDPLKIGSSNVYLTAHGYAPVVKVTNARGQVIFDGPTPCLPQDANVTSLCAIKIADDYITTSGKSTQLGFSGFFAPTQSPSSTSGPQSVFPALDNPKLFLAIYHGDLGVDSGIPQSVYTLDLSHMTQYKIAGDPLSVALVPGGGLKLPDGGTLTFEGTKQWVNFTIAHNPGTTAALVSAVLAILGLIGSLFIQRRRIWIRAVAGADGGTVVEVAGLARSESARIAEEIADLALALQDTAPADLAPDPDGASDPDDDVRAADAPLADLTSSKD